MSSHKKTSWQNTQLHHYQFQEYISLIHICLNSVNLYKELVLLKKILLSKEHYFKYK